jgi:hypothetical protein
MSKGFYFYKVFYQSGHTPSGKLMVKLTVRNFVQSHCLIKASLADELQLPDQIQWCSDKKQKAQQLLVF